MVVFGTQCLLVKVDAFTGAEDLLTVEHDVLKVLLKRGWWSELKTKVHFVKRVQEAKRINSGEGVDGPTAGVAGGIDGDLGLLNTAVPVPI